MKLGLLGLLLIFVGCNYRIDRTPDNSSVVNDLAEKPNSLSYAVLKRYVFDPKCMSCHSGGAVNLSNYELVKGQISAIKKVAVQDLTMPPKIPLSAAEIKILKTWIEIGAPENAKDGTVIPEDPLLPNFQSIQTKILNTRCVACHSNGGSADHIPLTTYWEILDSPREIVIPGVSEESGIMIAITRDDDKRMPPPDVGDALSEKEIRIIEKWIQEGAQE